MSSRVPITRDQVVRTAAKRLAEHGLAGISLRKLGNELGVSAPTLLWHVGSKRELLDAVASHLLAEARPEFYDRPREGQEWWDWLAERSRWTYEAMVGMRDAPLVVAGNRATPEMLPGTNTALGVLVESGFSAGEALQIFFVLGGFIGGMALETQADAAREQADSELEATVGIAMIAGDYPYLEQASASFQRLTPATTFDYGLDLLLRGIRSRHRGLTTSD